MVKRRREEAYGGYGGTADCPGCYGKPVSSTLLGCSRQNTHRRMLAAARGDDRLKALMTAVFFHFGRMARTGDPATRRKREKKQ